MLRRALPLICKLLLGAALLPACSTPTSLPVAANTIPQPPATSMPDVIRLANGEWPPYNGPDLPHNGCDSWLIREAFALEGITVEYGFYPWARSYNLSATGKWDGTLSWDDTPDHRKQHYLSAQPTTSQEWVFFYRADRPLIWKTLADLAGKTIGVTTGYVYSDAFKGLQTKKAVTFVESTSDESNFKMLLAGRIDAFPMERQVGHNILRSIFSPEQQTQIIDSPQAFAQYHSYLLLSKAVPQNEQRMVLFDDGFERLQASGRYAQIMQSCAQ
jgi:polar amino acid transport system substrate-binding protein